MENWMEELHEECGVFGVYHAAKAAALTHLGLHALQHRGQEGAGIAACENGQLLCRKGRGLLSDALSREDIALLTGESAIGHVRYSTQGGDEPENLQPLTARLGTGMIAAAHNGQIVNAWELRQKLEEQGSILYGTSDSEILLHLIQREKGHLTQKILAACRHLEGAFAFVILSENSLFAVRDKNGLRPLGVGKLGVGWCVASESCALEAVGATFLRDVQPGELLKFSSEGLTSFHYTEDTACRLCAMEYIYFARPDSTLDGKNVHQVRRITGRILAEKDQGKLEADLVIGVPDSSLSAALGYSDASGLPYDVGLVKNRYVGRTFIQPTQEQRDLGVQLKLSANRQVVEGKRVVLVDDSIVRGTTSQRIVRLLRQSGAKEVHLRIASPPIQYPCFYGVDTSTREELISARMDCQELCQYIGADSLRFLSVEEMERAYSGTGYCFACFNGKYATPLFHHKRALELA